MLNQVILVGKIIDREEKVVDNGTHAVILTIDTGNAQIPVWGRDDMAAHMLDMDMNTTLGVKGRAHNSPDGVNIIVEKLTFIKGGKA